METGAPTQEISALYNNGNGLAYGPNTSGRNVVSGNTNIGISLSGALNNQISGNYIGTTSNGYSALPNGDGIYISSGSNGNVIGVNNNGEGSGNIVSGNNSNGINLSNGNNNVIAGNLVGTGADGATALGNGNDGVIVYAGTGNRVGTNGDGSGDELERNIVSGNSNVSGIGVDINADNTIVVGNYIGVDVSGNFALGNGNGVTWLVTTTV